MKPIFLLTLTLMVLVISFPLSAIGTEPKPVDNALMQLSVGDFVGMNAKEYGQFTGQKLSLKEKIAFGFIKGQVKRSLRDGSISMYDPASTAIPASGTFNWGAFALGFLLGLIGVLIVAIAFKDKSALKYSLYGLAAWLVILVLILVI